MRNRGEGNPEEGRRGRWRGGRVGYEVRNARGEVLYGMERWSMASFYHNAHLMATANPCIISPAFGPVRCSPITLFLP